MPFLKPTNRLTAWKHSRKSCCCCHDEPVRQLPIWGNKDVPKRWGIPPNSESGGIRLSLVMVDSHLLTGGTTHGRLSLPTADVLSTIVKRSMSTDVDKLSSCSRFSDSVVGFTGQQTQATASKYWRKNIQVLKEEKGKVSPVSTICQFSPESLQVRLDPKSKLLVTIWAGHFTSQTPFLLANHAKALNDDQRPIGTLIILLLGLYHDGHQPWRPQGIPWWPQQWKCDKLTAYI